MDILSKELKFFYLTTRKNKERVKNITSILKTYDLREFNPGIPCEKNRSGAVDMSRMVDLGLRFQDPETPFSPFVILEDDISFFRPLPEKMTVPKDCDMFFLGVADSVMNPKSERSGAWDIYATDYNEEIIRIYNMLDTHAVMITSAAGAAAFQRCMMEAYYTGKPWDIYTARIQPFYNVYAFKIPIFYQDSRLGGLETQTKIVINKYKKPEEPYKDNVSIKSACNAYNPEKYFSDLRWGGTDVEFSLLNDKSFYLERETNYPPFATGASIENYFLDKYKEGKFCTKRKYIPALWTNLINSDNFLITIDMYQKVLDTWLNENPSTTGYLVICQHADGPVLRLPENTSIYGGSEGDYPLPLIYEDASKTLENFPKKKYSEKKYLCSFVGSDSQNFRGSDVRKTMREFFRDDKRFSIITTGEWNREVNKDNQNNFMNMTTDSKFTLAPRGYGRSSFRFFEAFKLGTVPVYVWDDIIWLPYQDVLDYTKFSFIVREEELCGLGDILEEVDETKYLSMLEEYEKVKHFFTLEGLFDYVKNENKSY